MKLPWQSGEDYAGFYGDEGCLTFTSSLHTLAAATTVVVPAVTAWGQAAADEGQASPTPAAAAL